jgi:2-iminobutanoate/2-iminopropanoate deaminase
MGKQIQNVYQDISETLKAHDASLRNIVKETVYTTDLDALAKNADVRARFFQGEDIAPPASSWVQVSRLGDPEWLIEVEVTAVLDQEY